MPAAVDRRPGPPLDRAAVDAPSTAVGPIALAIRADHVFAPHVRDLLAGYTASPTPPARSSSDVPRHELRLTLHRGNPTSSQRHPTFTDRNGVLVDESSGWLSKIHFSPGVTRATFALRDQSEFGRAGDAYMAKWVAGAVRVALALVAPRVGGLLLHGAASSSGIALLGPSGAGKTTLARRLSGALCDDAVLVFKRDRWRLSGTPVPGREGLPRSGAEATLATLVHLVPAQPLAMAPLSEAQALSALLQRVLYFTAPDAAFFATAHDLVRSVRSYRLTSSLDDDVTPLLAAPPTGRVA